MFAEGGLVHAVRESEASRRVSLARAAGASARLTPRLLSIFAILFVALFALLAPLVLVQILARKLLGGSPVVTALLIVALSPTYLLLSLAAIFVFQWAIRVSALRGKGAFASIAETLSTLRARGGRALSLVIGSLLNEVIALTLLVLAAIRSEERRVGKECRL